MQIEKYRKEQLEKNASCEVRDVKHYYYTCACPGKEHKLTESMHIFVSNSTHPINCKECHQRIHFKAQR